MPWQVEFRAGLWLPQVGWWLDAHFPVERSFVSHAHSDHTALHREVLCSAGTSALMQARLPGKRTEHVLPFGHTEALTPDCAVTLHPAGHIFGSAQALLEHAEHGRLLYSGDFKLRRGLSAEPCATPPTDLLIMETTFGRPHYVFPPTEQVLNDIAHFCHETLANGDTPVLFGYSLGKSQELLSGLAAAQLPVMLHPQTHKLTLVYERCGIAFPPHREFAAEQLEGHVVICPPQSRESAFVRRIPRARTAVITGWAIDPGAIYRYQCDAAFPLSDHADFPDLLRYVDLVQPKRVLTLHGFAQEFAQTLRSRGVEAWAIGQDNQLELPISGGRPARIDHPVRPQEPGACTTPTADPTAFARFAVVADAVKATPSKLEKIAALKDYLAELTPDDAAIAATFFTGRAFPQRDPRNLHLGWAVIKRAVLEVAGVTEADYRAAYHRFADAGDATGAVLAQRFAAPDTEPSECHVIRDIPPELDGPDRPENDTTECHVIRDIPLVPGALERPANDHGLRGAEATPAAPIGSESTPAECHVLRDIPSERVARGGTESTATRPGEEPALGCALADIAAFFRDAAAARGPAAKLDLLRGRLAILSPDEARYLVKIITGDLRIGLKEGLIEEAVAGAAGHPVEAVREANMLCGDIAAVTRAARRGELASIALTVFHPLQFMLASPEPTAEAILERMREASPHNNDQHPASDAEPPALNEAPVRDEPRTPGEQQPATDAATHPVTVWLEEKYDGIRCQLHKAGTRVELYSRDLNRITDQFPDLVRAATEIPGDFIGDGELLAWRDGRALPFAELQKRLGRKGDDFFLGEEIPVSISFYDLLWLNGRALLKEPLATRRALLEQLLALPGDAGRTTIANETEAVPSLRSAVPPPGGGDAPVAAAWAEPSQASNPAGSAALTHQSPDSVVGASGTVARASSPPTEPNDAASRGTQASESASTFDVGSPTFGVGRSSGPPAWTQRFRVAPVRQATTADEIEAAFISARQRGNEGLMAKDPRSSYTPGRRGLAWLKLKKAYATLDVVVVGVEYGHGKRRDVLSDYTFAIRDTEHDRLLTVGKAYSGLTDVEIARLTQHFLDHTLEVRGRYRVVVPDKVIEVAFDIIQPSNRHQSGFALRFPRIARLRPDKTPADIDTLETCRRLANAGPFADSAGAPENGAPPPSPV